MKTYSLFLLLILALASCKSKEPVATADASVAPAEPVKHDVYTAYFANNESFPADDWTHRVYTDFRVFSDDFGSAPFPGVDQDLLIPEDFKEHYLVAVVGRLEKGRAVLTVNDVARGEKGIDLHCTYASNVQGRGNATRGLALVLIPKEEAGPVMVMVAGRKPVKLSVK